MDQKTIDFVLKSIESLGNGQKVLARKVIELNGVMHLRTPQKRSEMKNPTKKRHLRPK